MKFRTVLGAGLALAALPSAAAAQAADAAPCVTEQEVASLIRYGLPEAISAARVSCAARLAPDGFLARGGTALQARYVAQKNAAWPGARAGLLKIANVSNDEDIATLAALPDEAVRPLIDALIQQKVAEAIKPATCGDIERLAEVLAPLEPQELGAISGVLASLVLKDKDPKVCPAGTR